LPGFGKSRPDLQGYFRVKIKNPGVKMAELYKFYGDSITWLLIP